MEGRVETTGGGGEIMLGFGENHCTGLTSMGMMMPVTDSGLGLSHRQFLLPPMHNKFTHKTHNASDQRASASSHVIHEKHSLPHDSESDGYTMRAKIMAHPLFPRLLTAYVNCQKVGAPHEVAASLEDACAKSDFAAGGKTRRGCMGEDPGLDQFMEAYCEMLIKYEQELTKTFKEAMLSFSRIDSQLKALAGPTGSSSPDYVEACDTHIDPLSEDMELKTQLMQKYSGYLGSLRKEFLKKKKNGKLPKQARQLLLDWWSRHCKWPYPSEAQKLALAQVTGLHLKQINNWFINQRKRHWKPCEDMQYIMMDAHTNSDLGMENEFCKPYPLDYMPMLL